MDWILIRSGLVINFLKLASDLSVAYVLRMFNTNFSLKKIGRNMKLYTDNSN